jgi:hypothetical protein
MTAAGFVIANEQAAYGRLSCFRLAESAAAKLAEVRGLDSVFIVCREADVGVLPGSSYRVVGPDRHEVDKLIPWLGSGPARDYDVCLLYNACFPFIEPRRLEEVFESVRSGASWAACLSRPARVADVVRPLVHRVVPAVLDAAWAWRPATVALPPAGKFDTISVTAREAIDVRDEDQRVAATAMAAYGET